MATVHTVPTDYATLVAALAAAAVKNGDTIQLHDTHVENSADVTISKQVTIKTLGSGQATISKQLLIDASNVTITNLRFNGVNSSDETGFIRHKPGSAIENLTITYNTFDGLPQATTNNGMTYKAILEIDTTSFGPNAVAETKAGVTAGSKFSGILTFDNNTCLQIRSGACIEVARVAEGSSITEFYCRDNKFIDHIGAIVMRGGNYSHYQGEYNDNGTWKKIWNTVKGYNSNGYVTGKSDTICQKAVVSGNKINVDGAPGTVAASLAAKAAGGSSTGSALSITSSNPWGMFEINQCKDVEFNNNVLKHITTIYHTAACLQTWNASEEWELNVKNNIIQDTSGCHGIKVYVRYYGFGFDRNGASWAYMPSGKIEKNDFINVDGYALNADCKYVETYKGTTSDNHDNFTVAQYNTAADLNTVNNAMNKPSGYNKKTVHGSRQKWANYATKPTLNCQNNYFYPTTGLPGSDVSGNDVAVSNNVPPRIHDLSLNALVGDLDYTTYVDSGTSTYEPQPWRPTDNRGSGMYKTYVQHPKNESSILNPFNYTFPSADENSVLLQQGAVATLDTRNYSLTRHNQYLDYNTYSAYGATENVSVQVPVLFDISGSSILFGEEYEADLMDAHLNFTLDMVGDGSNPFAAADLTSTFAVGDQDAPAEKEKIFFVNTNDNTNGNVVDGFCEKLSKAIINGKLKHIVSNGDHSTTGIPIGGQALVQADGSASGSYTKKYLDSIAPSAGPGENIGTCMARLAAVHLVGHPLSQAIFTNELQLQTDVAAETAILKGDGSTKFANTLSTQLSKALGGSQASVKLLGGLAGAGDNSTGVEKTQGRANVVLRSIYEQLMANAERATEVNAAVDKALTAGSDSKTTVAALPFHTGDEFVVYIRPKIHLTFDTAVQEGIAILDSEGAAMDISGLVHRDALSSNMASSFPGCSAGQDGGQAYKYSWMGSPDNVRNTGNGRDLDQETTDETSPQVLDAHVWKITIKL